MCFSCSPGPALIDLDSRLELLCAPGREQAGGLVQDETLIPAGFRRVFRSSDLEAVIG